LKAGQVQKKPILSDLRESGAIEQDADMVLFIYRPEYYGLTEDAGGQSTKDLAIVNIAKHRNGKLGDVNLRFIGQYARFDEPDSYESHVPDLQPNRDFEPSTRTFGSKMNYEENSENQTPENYPF
jgi:replicative DNA helicase